MLADVNMRGGVRVAGHGVVLQSRSEAEGRQCFRLVAGQARVATRLLLERELAAVFQIQSIPSMLFVPKDGAPQMAMGALPKDAFERAF
jgi:hypothetical protein